MINFITHWFFRNRSVAFASGLLGGYFWTVLIFWKELRAGSSKLPRKK